MGNFYNRYFVCPKCGNELDGGSGWDYGDESIYQTVECPCGFIYREVFTFAFNETIGTGEILDNEGNSTDNFVLDNSSIV